VPTPPDATEPLLEVQDLVVRYGAAVALDHVSLTVGKGELVALVGPNGAGKTTLLHAASRVLRPAAGSITTYGRLVQVPEGRQLFGELTVEDNLRVGAWSVKDRDPSRVYDLLPRLGELRYRVAETLSGGEQQMVAVGRGLMAQPDLLAVDELSLGLAPIVVDRLAEHLLQLSRTEGMAILLVEQNVTQAMAVADRAYVLEEGRIVATGIPAELMQQSRIQEAYLGL
jgi:branched-chain amino acid transport system ATP-binding protein